MGNDIQGQCEDKYKGMKVEKVMLYFGYNGRVVCTHTDGKLERIAGPHRVHH